MKAYTKGFLEGALYFAAVYYLLENPYAVGDGLRKLAQMVDGRTFVQEDAVVRKAAV